MSRWAAPGLGYPNATVAPYMDEPSAPLRTNDEVTFIALQAHSQGRQRQVMELIAAHYAESEELQRQFDAQTRARNSALLLLFADHHYGELSAATIAAMRLHTPVALVFSTARTRAHITKERLGDAAFIFQHCAHAVPRPRYVMAGSDQDRHILVGYTADMERWLLLVLERAPSEKPVNGMHGWLLVGARRLGKTKFRQYQNRGQLIAIAA